MCVRVLSEQNESLINAGLAEASLQEFFISNNMRDNRLVKFASQFLKTFFFTNCRTCNNAGHARESCRNLQENVVDTCRNGYHNRCAGSSMQDYNSRAS